MSGDQVLEVALKLAEYFDAPVFPCSANKKPLTERGFKDAARDPVQIEQLFANKNASLVGIPTGEISGISVIDLDKDETQPENDGLSWFNQNKQNLPMTRMVKTQSGGFHLYYKHIQGIRCSTSKIAEKVDIRGEGGYVIAGGLGYTVVDDLPLAEFPNWVERLLGSGKQQLVVSEEQKPGPIALLDFRKPGCWHESIRNNVASWVSRGVSKSIMLELSPLFTTADFSHEQTRSEIEKFIDSAVSKGFAPASYQPSESFRLKGYTELLLLKDPEFLVEGLLVERSTAMIFGPTSSFKSTVMIDLAVCIQNGLPWYGQETKASNVAILSHEDGAGFKKRYIAALEKYQVIEPTVFWDGVVPNLLDPLLIDSYIAEFQSREIGLVVIDTWAYAVAGHDENSSKDMGIAIKAIQRIRDEVGATVLIVHHTGKDAERGARGSSAVKSSVDTEIAIKADGRDIQFRNTKQRHCEELPILNLVAKVVEVGGSNACIIEKSEFLSAIVESNRGLKGQAMVAWQLLLPKLEEGSVSLEELVKILRESHRFTRRQTKEESFQKAFKRSIDEMQLKGLVILEGDQLLLGQSDEF